MSEGHSVRAGDELGTACQSGIHRQPVLLSSDHRLSSYLYDLIKSSINGGADGRGMRKAERSSVMARLVIQGANSSISP